MMWPGPPTRRAAGSHHSNRSPEKSGSVGGHLSDLLSGCSFEFCPKELGARRGRLGQAVD